MVAFSRSISGLSATYDGWNLEVNVITLAWAWMGV